MRLQIPHPAQPDTTATSVRVYDPAMCCSSGVCGPEVDADLVRFAADLDWLRGEGVRVERFNLAQQPGSFASEPLVRHLLQDTGEAGLPLVVVDGEVKSTGTYPSRDLLAEWTGVDASRSLWDERVVELAAIAASVASNCVSCVTAHERQARNLGISPADVRRAVEVGRSVREASASRVEQQAERLLERRSPELPGADAAPPSCC